LTFGPKDRILQAYSNETEHEMQQEIAEILANLFKVSPEALAAYVQERQEAARRRMMSKRASWERSVRAMTNVQSVIIDDMTHDGYQLNKSWTNRASGRVAFMLVKELWNSAKGRVGTKLVMVYPDGSRVETFEKTISVKQVF
jgi:hypothetical protein